MSALPEEDRAGPVDRRLLGRVLRFARPYAGRLATSVLLLVGLAAASVAAPRLLGALVDDYLPRSAAEAATRAPEETARLKEGVLKISAALLALGVATFVLRRRQLLLVNATGQEILHDLRLAVFRHISTRSLRFFDRHQTGRLVTRVTNDVEALNELFVAGVDVMFFDLLRILAFVGVLFVVDARMALVTLAATPFLAAWSWWFQRRARVLFREVRGRIGALNVKMTEALAGVRVVQLFRREARVAEDVVAANAALRDAHVATVRNYALFFPGMEFFGACGSAAIVFVGDRFFLDGTLGRGDLLGFWLYFALILEPLRGLADKFNVLQSALAAAERVFRVLDDDRALPVKTDAPRLERARGRVAFERVSFAYDADRPVLKDVSFVVEPGATVAFVGPTGSGKSTIISLLLRFYDPDAGRVLFDDRDVRDLRPEDLRRHVGVVLQDVFLFAGSVRENLTLDDPNVDDGRLLAALKAVGAERLVARLGGLDGVLAERGAGLSTGEKQLLAFARTLAHDPAVLVLDEATANVDTESEREIQRALELLMKGRTTLVVAHRLSTIRRADRIVVVHHGVVREAGTHAELLALDGVYARLHRLQFKAA